MRLMEQHRGWVEVESTVGANPERAAPGVGAAVAAAT